MDLQDLMVDSKSVWMDFEGLDGFKVLVATLSRKELANIRKSSIVSKFDRKSRVAIEELDEEKFVSKFAKATVKDWKGLKLRHLETLILVDTEGKDLDEELEYSEKNAEILVANSSEFDTWLNEVCFDLNSFRSRTEN